MSNFGFKKEDAAKPLVCRVFHPGFDYRLKIRNVDERHEKVIGHNHKVWSIVVQLPEGILFHAPQGLTDRINPSGFAIYVFRLSFPSLDLIPLSFREPILLGLASRQQFTTPVRVLDLNEDRP